MTPYQYLLNFLVYSWGVDSAPLPCGPFEARVADLAQQLLVYVAPLEGLRRGSVSRASIVKLGFISDP